MQQVGLVPVVLQSRWASSPIFLTDGRGLVPADRGVVLGSGFYERAEH